MVRCAGLNKDYSTSKIYITIHNLVYSISRNERTGSTENKPLVMSQHNPIIG